MPPKECKSKRFFNLFELYPQFKIKEVHVFTSLKKTHKAENTLLLYTNKSKEKLAKFLGQKLRPFSCFVCGYSPKRPPKMKEEKDKRH